MKSTALIETREVPKYDGRGRRLAAAFGASGLTLRAFTERGKRPTRCLVAG